MQLIEFLSDINQSKVIRIESDTEDELNTLKTPIKMLEPADLL